MDLEKRNDLCRSATKLIIAKKISFNTSFSTTLRNIQIFQTWENKTLFNYVSKDVLSDYTHLALTCYDII